MPIHLTGITFYPIKSTRRVETDEAFVERQGLRGDRSWMVVDEAGECITQRSEPRLALVQARFENGGVAVSAPDMPTIRIPVPSSGELAPSTSSESPDRTSNPAEDERSVNGRTFVRIWDDTVEAIEAIGHAGDWFTQYLDRPARLVCMDRPDARKVDPAHAVRADDHVSFADGYPLLLASAESLKDLNRRTNAPVKMSRFRPNLVVSGAEAFQEDAWRKIRIGDVLFDVVKGCARCTVTTIDQDTARRGKEPLRTLNEFRKQDSKVYFGQNLIPANEGVVRVGDVLHVGDER